MVHIYWFFFCNFAMSLNALLTMENVSNEEFGLCDISLNLLCPMTSNCVLCVLRALFVYICADGAFMMNYCVGQTVLFVNKF